MKNIIYKTKEIKEYFSQNRIKWSQFYLSERKILNKHITNNRSIIDIGCGCGGLGLSIFQIRKGMFYEGIEINRDAANFGKKYFSNKRLIIHNKDFLKMNLKKILILSHYDYVISLSCIDWQLNFIKSIEKAIKLLHYKSKFIISMRLTMQMTLNDITKSYQFINYSGVKKGEKAPYVIINILEFIGILQKFNLYIDDIYGYYKSPSITAITSIKKIFFSVLVLKLGKRSFQYNLNKLPKNFFENQY